MYENFFGLNDNPFKLSPDPFFMFTSETSAEALAAISDGVRQRKGFIVLTGEVGTGKTLVLRCLLDLWEREETPYAYFIGPKLSTVDFLSYIAFELGITVTEATKGNLLRALYGFLMAQFEKGLTTVLVVDEAHQMPRSVLEEIRTLANFETAQQKLVQIVLVGQPELDKKLDSPDLRSLKQRIAVRCRLEPLRFDEVHNYIERRLQLAGADPREQLFPTDTIEAIYKYSGGIPRLVNSICDQALMVASSKQFRVIPSDVIKQVASRFRLDPAANRKPLEVLSTETAVKPNADKTREILEEPATSASDAVELALSPSQESFHKHWNPNDSLAAQPDTHEKPDVGSDPPGLSSRMLRWLRPSFRMSMIIGILVFVPMSLTAGFLVAHHQKKIRRADYQPISKEEIVFKPTAASTAAIDEHLAVQTVNLAQDVAPEVDVAHTSPKITTRQPKLFENTLPRPLARVPQRASALANIEPPRISDTQINSFPWGNRISAVNPPPAESAVIPAPKVANSASAPGVQVKQPRLLKSVLPEYPAMARQLHAQGDVTLSILVDKTGSVSDVMIISGPTALREAAVDAVRKWKYEPSLLDGQPAAVWVRVNLRFEG